MNCPACRDPLIVVEIHEIEIDHCVSCGGTWLDAGELELLLESAANRDNLMSSLTEGLAGKETTIRCPICSKKLDKVVYGVDDKVVLDKCPRNHGLWFDRGELQDVIEMGNFPANHDVYQLISDVFGRNPRGDAL